MLRLLAILIVVFCAGSPAFASPPRVAADILPIHSLVSQVMDGVGKPSLVVPAGASPHHHALRPSEARSIRRAEITFWAGETLSPWLVNPLQTLSSGGEIIDLLDTQGTGLLDLRSNFIGLKKTVDGNAETGGKHTHGLSNRSHGHDPHAWLDPENAILWLGVIADELGKADPDNADRYLANARAGQALIRGSLEPDLAPTQNRYAVYHDAYQYFEAVYDLAPPIIISASDASGPGAAHLRNVRQRLVESNVTCLFAETGFSKQLVDRLTEGTDIRVIELDPLGSKYSKGRTLYPDIIAGMQSAFQDCSLLGPS